MMASEAEKASLIDVFQKYPSDVQCPSQHVSQSFWSEQESGFELPTNAHKSGGKF